MNNRRRLLSALTLALVVQPLAGQTPDRAALEALYHATAGPQWRNADGWLSDQPLSEWHGIAIAEDRVVEINLPGNGLVGELPPELGSLNLLYELDLRWNALSGEIPEAMASMTNLSRLYLTSNELAGPVPAWLGYLPDLMEVDLSYNQLTEEIPEELGYLPRLQGLGLHHNELTGGIPAALGDAYELRRIVVSHTNLSGAIPPRVSELPSLEHLNTDNTAIVGSLGSDFSRDALRRLDSLEATAEPLVFFGPITGLDVLHESVVVIPDEYFVGLLEQAMSAILIRDGLIWVDEPALPAEIPADVVVPVMHDINRRLLENGERIESVDDLSYALEVYGGGRIEVTAEDPSLDPLAAAPGSDTSTSAASGTSTSTLVLYANQASGAQIQQHLTPAVNCGRPRIDYPHATYRGVIRSVVSKLTMTCRRLTTVAQTFRYYAFAELQYWIGTGAIGRWNVLGRSMHYRGSPPEPAIWTAAEVSTLCIDGNWRGQLTLYAWGTVYGRLSPYPSRRLGASRNITC